MMRQGEVVVETSSTGSPQVDLLDVAVPLLAHWRRLILAPLLVGALAVGATFLVAPTFTAKTTFMPPQQQQSAAATAIASLGALASLAGATGVRTPADQYVAFMQSVTVYDRIIDKFELMKIYDSEFRADARKTLDRHVRISSGKKDGLITVEVDDTSPRRSADMANQFVEELRRLTSTLAITEAQQRRMFFEKQLEIVQQHLAGAQRTLESSGFSRGALRAEPKAAAEAYARLKAELTAGEVKLQAMRGRFADSAPEIQQQLESLGALRSQLSRLEQADTAPLGDDYIGRYRDFKYQEKLFELFAQQFELAKVDESREGAIIQVVDSAIPPEHKSAPRRGLIGAAAAVLTFLGLAGFLVVRHILRLMPRNNLPLSERLRRFEESA